MTSPWKSSLSALDRYETIQDIITKRGVPIQEATSVEQTAYDTSTSLAEYKSIANTNTSSALPDSKDQSIHGPKTTKSEDENKDYGITIGSYKQCVPLATGVTSQVYLSDTIALKVVHTQTEPHNPKREAHILDLLSKTPSIIRLLDAFRDHDGNPVLAFPYMPLTLADVINSHPTIAQTRAIFGDILRGLQGMSDQGMIHRDIKPSAILLPSPSGPALISDFGTTWHPSFPEPTDDKILDIGTSIYRAPEVLFGNKSYGPEVDIWAAGVMLAECLGKTIFESRPASEDGSQLGLILSIFKTLGTPTEETWPEAKEFKVKPFELWTVFQGKTWEEILPDVDGDFRDLVAAMVKYDGSRVTAEKALEFKCFTHKTI